MPKCLVTWLKFQLLMIATSIAAVTGIASGQEAEDKLGEVQATSAAYLEAFNQGDIDQMIALWSPDAIWVHGDGTKTQGLEPIRALLLDGASGKAELAIREASFQAVTADVVIEEGVAVLIVDGKQIGEESYEILYVRENDRWLIRKLREIENRTEEVSASPLEELGWLEGEWGEVSEESQYRSRISWAANRAFLIHNFTVDFVDQPKLQGVQVIGWDPRNNQIRSWIFDTDGAFGDSTWTRDGERWSVETTMVLKDANVARSTHVYHPVDVNEFRWRAYGRRVGDVFLPNLPEISVRRVAQPDPMASETSSETVGADNK